MLAGVASGIADYLGIDPVLVRIAFVVLTLLGGFGILAYLAAWLLMPEEGTDTSAAHRAITAGASRRHPLLIIVAVAILIVAVLAVLASGPWWGSGWHEGFGVGWFVLALVVVVLVLYLRRSGGTGLGRLFGSALLVLVVLATLAVGAVFAAEALTGVPLSGGIGDRQWQPTNAAQVDRTYRLALGNLTVDLRGVQFPPGATHMTASVGIGHLLVEVPPGLQVSVTAHSGIGVVNYGNDQTATGFSNSTNGRALTAQNNSPRLVLTAEAGIGEVQLVRGSPGY
jgi:phage shock protein PspC (stress-responsive transcriptional regulator)